MKRASLQLRALAEQLKSFEAAGNRFGEADNPAVFLTINRLVSHLSFLMGQSGVQALHARALVLAAEEVPWLTTLRVVADGKLEGLAAAHATVDAADFSEGEVVLLAQILRLLVAFIGPNLTLRLLNQLWPQLPLNAAALSNA